MKKLIFVLLLVCATLLCLAACNPTQPTASSSSSSSSSSSTQKPASYGLKYTLSEDGTYYIVSGRGDCKDTELVIPPTHEGLPVKKIGYKAFYRFIGLTSVTIGNNVTDIGHYAFSLCINLVSVKMGSSVTTIGSNAFAHCRSLASLAIGENVTIIDIHAFFDCGALVSVTIPNGVTTIGGSAFFLCHELTSVTFETPNGWWLADSADATSGADIAAAELADPATAAQYLKDTYYNRYWHRN